MKAKILIVYDSYMDCMNIKEMLRDYYVITAANDLEAMDKIEMEQNIDLIILDLDMQEIHGYQILEMFKSNEAYQNISIIVISNFGGTLNQMNALKLGAIDYVSKPFNEAHLRTIIDMHIQINKIESGMDKNNKISNLLVALRTAELMNLFENTKNSEMLFRTIIEQAPIGIAIVQNGMNNLDKFNVRNINPMFESILGRTKEEILQLNWEEITHPDDLDTDKNCFKRFHNGEIDFYEMEKRYRKTDGSYVWVHMFITRILLHYCSEDSHICLLEDIDSRKTMEKVLYESERSKSVLLANLPGMAYRCRYDREWTMRFVSEGCFELTGYRAEDLIDNTKLSFNDLIVPEYRQMLWTEWEHMISQKKSLKYEYEIIAANGTRKWVLEIGQGVYDNSNNIEALEGIIIDITDQKEREFKIQHLHEYDSLTQLYNRRHLHKVLEKDLSNTRKVRKAVVLLDMKNFDILTHTYGYNFLERIIKELACNLSLLCKDKCELFYISINRFAFYIKDYINTKELTDLCENIKETLNTTLSIKTINGSIGVVEIDHRFSDAGSILKNALIASENTPGNDSYEFRFFDGKMEERIIREAYLTDVLSKVTLDKERSLYMQYQPILDIKTHRICGFEALARLETDQLGEVSPIEFIPVAEETQLIIPLGRKILLLAIGFLRELKMSGFEGIQVSINISLIQLYREDFVSDLMEILIETKISPYNLCLEITESVFSKNFQEINEKLNQIRASGIHIAIDDFGTGYSSLARQNELNADYLKIDKYFIEKLMVMDCNQSITSDIISMAHKMGQSVIAEGVEQEVQKQYLIDNDCDCLQGFYFSRPLSQEGALGILKSVNGPQ